MATATEVSPAIERAKRDRERMIADYNLGKPISVELIHGMQPAEDVLHFWAVLLNDGTTRVGIIYLLPGREGFTYVGADLDRSDAPRWFSRRGVPTLRVARRLPKRNSRSTH